MYDEKPVTLNLTGDEALVFHDWLSRFNDRPDEGLHESFEDQAEQRVLWDLECLLEKALVAPFDPDYQATLMRARERIRDATD